MGQGSPSGRGSYRGIVDFYDAEYAHLSLLREDVSFMLAHFPRRACDVLEIAVGTGRAAVQIAQHGHRVVGIDHDPQMIRAAEEKRSAFGIDPRRLQLHRVDALDLDLGRQFDRVVLLFNTMLNFVELERLDRLLQRVKAHLKPAGRFWVDVFNPDPVRLARRSERGIEPSVFHVPHLDRTVYRDMDIDIDATAQRQRICFNYRWFEAGGRERRARVRFELTFIFPRELRVLLERNGLGIERWWGDYDGSPLDPDSPRIIASVRHRRGDRGGRGRRPSRHGSGG